MGAPTAWGIPSDHAAQLVKLKRDGVITDWEPEGEWDQYGTTFTQAAQENGERVYRVWFPKPDDDEE